MARAPFQVLGIVFCRTSQALRIALFKRSTDNTWQGLAGGGEDQESPAQALMREINEEAAIQATPSAIFPLDSQVMVPRTYFAGHEAWPDSLYVIPMYSFAVELSECCPAFSLSDEHVEARWISAKEAKALCRYDSDRVAIWELQQRIVDGNLHSLSAAPTHSTG